MANRKAKIDKPYADEPDQYDRDLERDNSRLPDGRTRLDAAAPYEPSPEERHASGGDSGRVYPQKDRKGQAQSPVEETHNEPPKQREGH
jgi:hypothetical protein